MIVIICFGVGFFWEGFFILIGVVLREFLLGIFLGIKVLVGGGGGVLVGVLFLVVNSFLVFCFFCSIESKICKKLRM